MSFFNILQLAAGLAFLIFGVFTLRGGLLAMAGGHLQSALETLTKTFPRAFLLGVCITALVQSSGAVTIVLVGLVGAGLMSLERAIPIVLGSNIGTTLTPQLLRMGGGGTLLFFLNPKNLSPLFLALGMLFLFTAQNSPRKKAAGQILLGAGLMFCGMSLMELGAVPLRTLPAFAQLFSTLSNPLLGFLAGTAVTAAMQSSTACVALLQALAGSGVITKSAGYAIVLGQNLGTCFTTLAASLGAGRAARQVALVHLYINLITGVLGVAFLFFVAAPFAEFLAVPISAGGVANFHTVYNVASSLLFAPFTRALAALARRTAGK